MFELGPICTSSRTRAIPFEVSCLTGSAARGATIPIWEFPKIGGPQYRPPNTIVLIIGTPKKGTPNFGKPPYSSIVLWFSLA